MIFLGEANMAAHIMVIEDNPTNMKLASNALEICGFEICCAANAKEALDKMPSFEPDVILMDIQLPDIDGLSLTRQIKQDPRLKHAFIIAITAYATKGDKEKTLAAGCDEYVAKPADIFDVIQMIKTQLGSANT